MSDEARRPRLGVLCPMPSELRPLTKRMALARAPTTDDGLLARSGTFDGVDVVATTTGIGMDAATTAAHRLLGSMAIDHLLVVGIAGGVHPDLEIGSMVVPEVVIDFATGTEYRPAPFGAAAPNGRLASSDDLLIDAEAQSRLVQGGVVAVDMETAAVAAVCEQQDCPWSVFRGISDRARDGMIDNDFLALAGPDGRGDLGAVARYLIRRPWRVARLARLGRDSGLAARRAADAAAVACHEHDLRPSR